ncbi:MAG: VWA domain-containing protein [Selenomonadaceae bacterium]|nr:VWA domain-containing protein [Selenomonadaceae bacterium]
MWKILLLTSAVLVALSSVSMARALPKPPAPPQASATLPEHKHTTDCDKTSPEPVEIICILDRSGSMQPVVDDTIGGYNSFLEKQKQEPGKAVVTTVLFDDQYEKIVDGVDLQKVPAMTNKEYYARGMTALLDAIGRTLTATAGKMEKEVICPEKRRVIVLIMTDGQENDSREYTKATVKNMIETAKEKYHWNFIFMGANIDSVAEAGAIGIAPQHAANYSHNRAGVQKSFAMMDAAAREVRETGSVDENWKEDVE